ncbi:MAG: TetR/AcrR family transcriptional regulator [Candidatus Omnitrophota bacterium]
MKRKLSEQRKREIIDTAKVLIIREGVRGLTIKNLSKKNRISEPAIYRHFKNKRAILVALIDYFERSLFEAIEQPIRHYKNPIDRLREIMKTHMEFTEKNKGYLFAITAESIHFNDDYLRRKILDVIEKYKIKILEILKEAKGEGLLRDDVNLGAVSLAYFGLIQAAIVQYALTNYTVTPITKFQTVWNVFIKGIAKENVKLQQNNNSKK